MKETGTGLGTISKDLATAAAGDNHCKKCGQPSGNLNMCAQHLAAFKANLANGNILKELKAEAAKDEKRAERKAIKKLAEGGKVDMRSWDEQMWTKLTLPERILLCEKMHVDGKCASSEWDKLHHLDQEALAKPKTVNFGKIMAASDAVVVPATGKAKAAAPKAVTKSGNQTINPEAAIIEDKPAAAPVVMKAKKTGKKATASLPLSADGDTLNIKQLAAKAGCPVIKVYKFLAVKYPETKLNGVNPSPETGKYNFAANDPIVDAVLAACK